ncbi:MAG: DNA gyrase inhibitor YacG [Planctomycetaceae bacterium]|nr:DNA gyrase inhibitor YacG [Planctomycetaceae bacterium]
MISPHRCPVCRKECTAAADSAGSAFPFCSDRCRKVDFCRWWDGRYAIVEEIDPEVAQFLKEETDIAVEEPSEGPSP